MPNAEDKQTSIGVACSPSTYAAYNSDMHIWGLTTVRVGREFGISADTTGNACRRGVLALNLPPNARSVELMLAVGSAITSTLLANPCAPNAEPHSICR